MKPEDFTGPYDNDVCKFCGKKPAAYSRPDSKGKLVDACEKCARSAFSEGAKQ